MWRWLVDTAELHILKYKPAMATDKAMYWQKSVDGCMVKNQVFEIWPFEEVPNGAKILTSTWSMMKGRNGTKCACLIACGYEQEDGQHYK